MSLVLEQTNDPGRYTACESWNSKLGGGEVDPSTFLGVSFQPEKPHSFLTPLSTWGLLHRSVCLRGENS